MVNVEIFGYMWEIIQSIYIRGLEDQSNDQSKIPESSSFGVHLEFSSINLDLDNSSKALKLTYSPSCSLELSHGSWPSVSGPFLSTA